ncbi:MAG TPA: hypothetical protein VH684_00045 [Xanthobacteraceae bacterium]|jgi:hypothetical protein
MLLRSDKTWRHAAAEFVLRRTELMTLALTLALMAAVAVVAFVACAALQ